MKFMIQKQTHGKPKQQCPHPEPISMQMSSETGILPIGGFIPDTRPGYEGSGDRSAINEVYDPQTDSWTTASPMPRRDNGFSTTLSAVFDNKIHIISGYLTESKTLLHYIYDPKTDIWSNGASPPSSTTEGDAGATTGINSVKRIYVLDQPLDSLTPSQTAQ